MEKVIHIKSFDELIDDLDEQSKLCNHKNTIKQERKIQNKTMIFTICKDCALVLKGEEI